MTGFTCAVCVFGITTAFFLRPTNTDPDDYQGIAWSSTPGTIFVILNTDATFNWTHTASGPLLNIAWNYKGTINDRELTYILGFSNNALYVPISDRSPRLEYLNSAGSAIMILRNVTLEDSGIYEAKVVDLDDRLSGNPQYISNDATLNVISRSELAFTVTIGNRTFELSVAMNGTKVILPDLDANAPTHFEVRVSAVSWAPNPIDIMIQNRFGEMIYTEHSCANAHKCNKQVQCSESQATNQQTDIVVIINFAIQNLGPIFVVQTIFFTGNVKTVTDVVLDPPIRSATTSKTMWLSLGITAGFLTVALFITVVLLCMRNQRHAYREVNKNDLELKLVPNLSSKARKTKKLMFVEQQYDHLHEVTRLTEFVVWPHLITCAEYCFSIVVNFEMEPAHDPAIVHLQQILTALLNTSGGIIRVTNNESKVPSQRTIATWQGKFESVIGEFLPDDVYHKFVQLSAKNENPMEALVKKSDVLVTMTTHMFVRRSSGNKLLRDIRSVQHVMSGSSSSPSARPFEEKSLKYGTSIKVKRGDGYIYWEAIERFDDEHVRSLLALANMPSGGFAIVGMKNNLQNGEIKVVGHAVTTDEEAKLSHFIGRSLRKDDTYSRIWGNINKTPERGTDWDVEFIPVGGDPIGRRSCVIVIHMKHCMGGVWAQCPESFMISETGHVLEMTFEVWKTAVTNTFVQAADISEISTNETDQSPDEPHHEHEESHTRASIEAQATLTRTYTKQIDDFLKNKGYLSFSEHSLIHYKDNFSGNATEFLDNIQRFAYGSSALKFANPMTLTPDRDTIILSKVGYREHLTEAIRHIETAQGATIKSFGIVSSSWVREIQACSEVEQPVGHLLDVFAMDEDGCMKLWTIVDEQTTGYTQRMAFEYTYSTGRMIKRRLMMEDYICRFLGLHFIASIWVECFVYEVNAGNELHHATTNEHCEYFTSAQSHITGVQLCLAKIFLKKDTRIKSIFGDELSFTLTSEQMETISRIELSKFNYIEGPPGSGKTYLALHVCRKYPNYGYICGTLTFEKFLLYQGLDADRIFCISSEMELETHLRKGLIKHVEYLIFDDFQSTQLREDLCHRLFDCVNKSDRMKLLIFGDSQYQRFLQKDTLMYLQNYCQKSKIRLTDMKLTEIHRNTRKVSSFIKSNFEGHSDISCSHTEDGDDVEVRHLLNVTSEKQGGNGLVNYVKDLVDPHKVVSNDMSSYEPKEVMILVDTENCTATTEKLRRIFIAEDIGIQDAGTFPVTGLTIDILENFMGFDRKVCILVCGKKIEKSDERSGHSLSNHRYRCFVASRGTAKVVFVVASDLNSHVASKFNFDNIPLEPIHRWSNHETVYDMCWLPLDQTVALLYITRRSGLRLVSQEGEHMNLIIDISGIGHPGSVTSSARGDTLVVLDCHSPYAWTVYDRDSPHRYVRLCSYNIEWKPISTNLNSAGDLLVVVQEDKADASRLRKYSPSDGRLLWERTMNAGYLHPGAVNTDRSDRVYVCEGERITIYSTGGDLVRTVTVPVGIGPVISLCVDPSGQWMFTGDSAGNVSLFHKGKLFRRHLIVTEDKWMHMLCLYEDAHLGLASRNMLHAYDVKGVLISKNIVV